MEKYRSGHNERDSKSCCPNGHVGSNPTFSATFEVFGIPKNLDFLLWEFFGNS